MGFGGDMPKEALRRPGRLWLGLGACLGLAAGGWRAAAWSPSIPPAGSPVIEHGVVMSNSSGFGGANVAVAV